MYLITHEYEPRIVNKKLRFVMSSFTPEAGVEVTSLTNKKYVVGPRGNLIKINPHLGSNFKDFMKEEGLS